MGRTIAKAMLAVVLSIGAAGCVNLKQKYVAVVGYALAPGTPDAAEGAKQAGVILKVRPLRVARMFEGRKLVYRMKGETWASDYYHEFFIEPAPMMTGLVHDWLTAARRWEVVQGSSFVPATHYVEGTILELYGDYANPEAPAGVLAIDLLAMEDRRGTPPRILLHKTYRESVPLAGAEAKDLVDGWNGALRTALTAFESDLAAALAQP